MSMSVGMPVLKLSNTGGASTKRKGDAKKVLCEGLNERYSKDQDLDRSKSVNNTYTGYKSGKELYSDWMEKANAHKDKLGRSLRKDAVIGGALIIKPDMESMSNLSEKEQDKFLDDSETIVRDILETSGLTIDAIARHKDELVPHDHVFFHDEDFTLGKKLNLKLFNRLNTEYPKRMRELGYDVKDMQVYDSEKAQKMSKDERAEYDAEMIRKKRAKKSGRSSEAFKAEKEAEAQKIIDKANTYKAEKEAEAQKIIDKANLYVKTQRETLENERKALDVKQKAIDAQTVVLNKQQADTKAVIAKVNKQIDDFNALTKSSEARKELLKREEEIYTEKCEEVVKKANTSAEAHDKAKMTYELATSHISMAYIPALKSFNESMKELLQSYNMKGKTLWDINESKVNTAYFNASEKAKEEMNKYLTDKSVSIEKQEKAIESMETIATAEEVRTDVEKQVYPDEKPKTEETTHKARRLPSFSELMNEQLQRKGNDTEYGG